MELNAESEFASRVRSSRPRKHSDSFPARTDIAPFWRLMVLLIPPPYTRDKLVDFFERRALIGAIRNWRYGHCTPPGWAFDIMRSHVHRRVAALNAAADSLKAMPSRGPGPGERGAAHWRRWNARQAEEREKKRASELLALEREQSAY
jgi:hypothetical protein